MKLQIKVDENGVISDVKFKTFGCGSAIASSSYMTERVKGLTLEKAGAIKNTEIAKELCLPPVKLHCSMLAEDAIRSAIKDYQSKRTKKAGASAGVGAQKVSNRPLFSSVTFELTQSCSPPLRHRSSSTSRKSTHKF